MSYKLTKPTDLDMKANRVLDEIGYALNDLSRRVEESAAQPPQQRTVKKVIQSGGGSSSGSGSQVKQYRMKCRINTEPNSILDGYLIKNIHLPSNTSTYIQTALNTNPYMTYIQCPIYVDMTKINPRYGVVYSGNNLLLSPQMAISESEDLDSTEHFDIGMYFSSSFYYDVEQYPVIFSLYITNDNNGDADVRMVVRSIDTTQTFFQLDDNYQVYFDLPEAVI